MFPGFRPSSSVTAQNLHDDSLKFEAIHRVVFGVEPLKLIEAFLEFYPNAHDRRVLTHPDPGRDALQNGAFRSPDQ